MPYRNTYVEVYLDNIKNNVEEIINHCRGYKYYFGVVKADCYGHYGNEVVKQIIAGGCNYLAVSSLEEALAIRKEIDDIPILCLEVIDSQYLSICKENNITITIPSLEYFDSIDLSNLASLKVHIKIDTGMNRLGINDSKELDTIYQKISKSNIKLEGLYTHIYKASDKTKTDAQLSKFCTLTKNIPLETIPIIHLTASEATILYPKPNFANGCRLGIAMYGFTKSNLNLLSTFRLVSEVIQLKYLKKGDTVGYDGAYRAKKDEIIAIVPIGYADGIIRANKGRFVYINNKKYQIVGNICMDMLFIKVDQTIKVKDKVIIIKDIKHIKEIAKQLNTIEYEVLCSIGKRVPRIYSLTKTIDK